MGEFRDKANMLSNFWFPTLHAFQNSYQGDGDLVDSKRGLDAQYNTNYIEQIQKMNYLI